MSPLNPSMILIQAHETLKSWIPESIREAGRSALVMVGQQQGKFEAEKYYESLSNDKNHLKIKFLLADEQMQKVKDYFEVTAQSCKIKGDSACAYQLWTRNCVDFVQELFEAGYGQGHFADFLTDEQLGSFQGLPSGPTSAWKSKAQEYALLHSRGKIKYLGGSSKIALNYGIEKTWSMARTLPLLDGMQNLAQSNWQSSDLNQFIKTNDPDTLIKLGLVCAKIGVDFAGKISRLWSFYQSDIVEPRKAAEKLKKLNKNLNSLITNSSELRKNYELISQKNDYNSFNQRNLNHELVDIDFELNELKKNLKKLKSKSSIREYSLNEVETKINQLQTKLNKFKIKSQVL